eukprot:gnl/MRDRNA2_/MRDRNA2_130160_c0_seq1.p1 gnl/MRDRNA2_/MRDRNA2_130160_c0~~gnl/MRDRNA2_/MRDRNA2_130160_c0_seq1.p1  ORF type:complete len:199 (+),score=38.47 gnl/MRDRNA2_/MRDRNA2_130160_c0_seq1:161-757(+)
MAAEAAFNSLRAAATFFEARWALTRSIRQRADGSLIAECQGEASFNAMKPEIWQPRMLKYEESGSMQLAANPAFPGNFKKTYVYVLQDETCDESSCVTKVCAKTPASDYLTLHLYFDNGKEEDLLPEDHYLSFALSELTEGHPVKSTEHLCIKDLYVGLLTLEPCGGWQLEYEVTGPNKDYVIKTRYQRLPCNHGSEV